MNIDYDKDADAIYIEFRRGKFGKNARIDDYTIIDLDTRGKLLGIELLDASKRLPKKSFSKVRLRNLRVVS